jgi:hypothetical protein
MRYKLYKTIPLWLSRDLVTYYLDRNELAGLGEAGSEVIFVDPVLQITNPKSSNFFERLRMVIGALRRLRRMHHRHRRLFSSLARQYVKPKPTTRRVGSPNIPTGLSIIFIFVYF